MSGVSVGRRLAAVMCGDVEGYSRLIGADDVGTMELLSRVRDRVGDLVRDHRGRVVDFSGDGFLAEFASVVGAVRAGLAIQDALATGQREQPSARRLRFRLGIHLGDVLTDGDRIYGEGVNVAARLEPLCTPGGVCVSGTVYDLVRGKIDVRFEDLGERYVKNIDDPIRAFRIGPAPEPQLSGEAAVEGAPHPGREAPAVASLGATRLIEREPELRRLRTVIDGAFGRRGAVALLSGPAGIGKTRLATEAATAAESRGAVFLTGRSYPAGSAPAFWPWIEVLRGLERDATALRALERQRAIEPSLTALWSGGPGVGPAGEAPGSGGGQFRLFDAVTRLLEEVSLSRPIVVLLDDIHWADASSLLLIEFLAPRIDRFALALLVTHLAPVAEQERLSRAVLALARTPRSERIVLRGLSSTGTRALVDESGGLDSPGLLQEIHRRSEGNPFFVLELARHVRETPVSERRPSDIPEPIRDLIGTRLAPLGEPTRELLRRGSVLDRELRVDVLAALGGTRRNAADAALEEASHRGIVEPVPGRPGSYRFTHALIRDSLGSALTPSLRARLHARAAAAIERTAPNADEAAAEIAFHLRNSLPYGSAKRALRWARRAGDAAASRYAHDEAAAHYKSALDLTAVHPSEGPALRCELLLATAEAQYRAGAGAQTLDLFREAAALARAADDASALARAALGFAGTALPFGADIPQSVPLLEEALAALGDRDDILRARLLSRLAIFEASTSGKIDLALERAAEALALAQRLGDADVLALALEARHAALRSPESRLERLACGQEIVRVAAEARDPELALLGRYGLIVDYLEGGDMDALDREIAAQRQLAEQSRQRLHLWRAARIKAMRALLAGDLGDAEAAATDALAIGSDFAAADAALNYGIQIFQLRWLQGRLGELASLLEQFAAQRPSAAAPRAGLALLRCVSGQRAEARVLYERLAVDDFQDLHFDPEWTTCAAALAELAARLGDSRRAHVLEQLLTPWSGSTLVVGATCCFGAGDYFLGILAATQNRFGDAEQRLRAALALHRKMGALPLVSRTLAALSQLALARSDGRGDREARRLREEAESIAGRVGMGPDSQ